jgi:tetratricopeptide (TPR) repeat protein
MVGHAAMHQGRWDEAEVVLQDALNEARTRGVGKSQTLCLNSLGILAERRDDRVRALEFFREALRLSRQLGDRRNEAIDLGNVGQLSMALGDRSAARRDLNEALRLVRQNGDRAMEPWPLTSLSTLALWDGDRELARALAHASRDTAKAVQARDRVASSCVCLGNAEAARSEWATAAAGYAEARDLATEIGSGWRFDASAGLADLCLTQGDISGAMQALQPLLPPAGIDAAAGSFPGAEWPRKIELTIHRVLAAASDPRAQAWLERAQSMLLAKAEAITDMARRQMFLTSIPHHVEIAALWSAHPARLSSPPHEGFEQGAAER